MALFCVNWSDLFGDVKHALQRARARVMVTATRAALQLAALLVALVGISYVFGPGPPSDESLIAATNIVGLGKSTTPAPPALQPDELGGADAVQAGGFGRAVPPAQIQTVASTARPAKAPYQGPGQTAGPSVPADSAPCSNRQADFQEKYFSLFSDMGRRFGCAPSPSPVLALLLREGWGSVYTQCEAADC